MKVSVLGGGSWATAIVKLLTNNTDVSWWHRSDDAVKYIHEYHHNPKYLQSVAFNIDKLCLSSNIETYDVFGYERFLACYRSASKIGAAGEIGVDTEKRKVPNETRFMILSPIVRHKKGEHKETLNMTKKSGFVRARIDGEIYLSLIHI